MIIWIPYYDEEFSEIGYYPLSESNTENKELIYSDDEYNYYSLLHKSDDLVLYFHLNGLKMTAKHALEKKYITPDQLHFDDIFLKKEKKQNLNSKDNERWKS